MKQNLAMLLMLCLFVGCDTPHPGSGFAPALLTRDGMQRIEDSVDPADRELPPWYRLSRTELERLLGPADYVEPSVEDGKTVAETLHYVRDPTRFSFTFEGKTMIMLAEWGIPKFSDPTFTEDSYTSTNPFRDIALTNVAFMVFGNGRSFPYFVSRDREEIASLYTKASEIEDSPRFMSYYWPLQTVTFCDNGGNDLLEFDVAGSELICMREFEGYRDKELMGISRELALAWFDLMLKHAPDILRRYSEAGEKDPLRKHFIPSFPFERLKIQETRDISHEQ